MDGTLIRKLAREIKGAAGPSNLDADGSRRILTAWFSEHSQNLCNALGQMAKKLCSNWNCDERDVSLEALLAGKLAPLDKNPSVTPV